MKPYLIIDWCMNHHRAPSPVPLNPISVMLLDRAVSWSLSILCWWKQGRNGPRGENEMHSFHIHIIIVLYISSHFIFNHVICRKTFKYFLITFAWSHTSRFMYDIKPIGVIPTRENAVPVTVFVSQDAAHRDDLTLEENVWTTWCIQGSFLRPRFPFPGVMVSPCFLERHLTQYHGSSSSGGTWIPTHTLCTENSIYFDLKNAWQEKTRERAGDPEYWPMIPVITFVTSYHGSAIILPSTAGTDPNLVPFIILSKMKVTLHDLVLQLGKKLTGIYWALQKYFLK